MSEHEEEVKELWGDTEQYHQFNVRTAKYSHADFALAKIDQEAVTEQFAYAFGNHFSITSSESQAAVIAHRKAISKWFYDCSVEMQKNLALMYVQDQRFKKYYDDRVHGLAQYVHDSILAQ